MTTEQADRMIELLELIKDRLGRIEDNLGNIEGVLSDVDANLDRANDANLDRANSVLSDIKSNTHEITNLTSDINVLDEIRDIIRNRE